MKTLEYYRNLDSNLVQHAIREMNPETGDTELKLQMLGIVEAFADMGHSGASAPWCANALARLFMFEPLGPLTGEDDEWNEDADMTLLFEFDEAECHKFNAFIAERLRDVLPNDYQVEVISRW